MTTYYQCGGPGGAVYPEDNHVARALGKPVVVIDPEDSEQVERLREAMLRNDRHEGRPCYSTTCHADRLAQSLRDLATKKPEEPTGLGAVVEDAKGERWMRTSDANLPWYKNLSQGDDWRDWYDIDVVKVLSEGVPS